MRKIKVTYKSVETGARLEYNDKHDRLVLVPHRRRTRTLFITRPLRGHVA